MGRKGGTLRDYIFIDILAHTFSLEVWVKTPLFSDFIGKCFGKLLCIMNTGVRHYLALKITGHSFFDPHPSPKNFPWRFIANNRKLHTCQAVRCSSVCSIGSCRGWKQVRRLCRQQAPVRLTHPGGCRAAVGTRPRPFPCGMILSFQG